MNDPIYYSEQAKGGYPPYPYSYQGQEHSGLTLKETIQYSLLGIIVIGGAVIVGKNMVKKAVANKEQRKTLDDGSTATLAKQVKMAFHNDGWYGTNKDELRTALQSVKSKKDFTKVMSSYQKLYNSSLLGDMQKALRSTEYDEMLAIISAKPETNEDTVVGVTSVQVNEWAKRLKAAFDITYGPFPGTDEDAIKAVFLEIPTQDVYGQVGTAYKTMYGNDLDADLKSELFFWQYDPMMQLIYSKPNS